MPYKRILTIQDISCVGQCSMTVALPILSACGHETCILPTAVLSTHTGGFGKPVVQHISVDGMWQHWKAQGIKFDAVLVGYLGSISAVKMVSRILDEMLSVLEPRQQQVLRLRYGMEDGICHTLSQIGTILGISKERARQVERQALDKLHKIGADRGLEDFLG